MAYLSGKPRVDPAASDLEFEPMLQTAHQADLDRIDREVLGFTRPQDHGWLQGDRTGFVARRAGRVVGYGYQGEASGPFAAVVEADLPALLAHGETLAAPTQSEFGVDLPLTNRAAVTHLLTRGYRLDPFLAYFLSDRPGVRLANYVFPSPPFFT